MAFLHRLTPDELEQEGFVFKGWFADCVPIYLSDPEAPGEDFPLVMARNGVPEWVLDLAIFLFAACAHVVGACGGQCEGFPVRLTRYIDGTEIDFIDDEHDDYQGF